ncbi:hypothetical protein K438DRAFT_1602766 [Mycena galopus ATCC 62051]|nr:hypothetical protein K438DRAFT_1602766 [Mycena galopus ATCC 62051]
MYSGLGFRPHDYVPNAHDYQGYLWARDRFLQSPRGHAAKLYGGIVGRLASGVVPDDEVLRGRTDNVTLEGICLSARGSEWGYWDDWLSEREIDLICGVYHISTGTGEQTSTKSWWPKPSAMAQSGLCVGWWTPMCEAWYQRRLGQLADPERANLLTHGKWKHNLKMERKCPPLVAATECLAAQILERLIP